MKNPNPQGKGLVPTLQALESVSNGLPSKRGSDTIILDYLASALVLSARFTFKPVINTDYYLYWEQDCWQLSMVSPAEWGDRLTAKPVARCRLCDDLSWTLFPLDDQEPDPDVAEALLAFQTSFLSTIDTSAPLQDSLPFYEQSLPWYPRLMALGLAKTLQHSLAALPVELRSGQALIASHTHHSLFLSSAPASPQQTS